MKSIEFPLEAAVEDVVFRYKKGNDMLASCAAALRRLKERIDAGEAGPDWDWPRYRAIHLEQHISKRWINVQLKLAPPGATDSEVAENAEQLRKADRDRKKIKREGRPSHLTRTPEYAQGAAPDDVPTVTDQDVTQSPDPHPGVAVSAAGGSEVPPIATASGTTPHDAREGGDMRSTLRPPREGLVPYWIDPSDPMTLLAASLSMAMRVTKGITAKAAVADWPPDMPMLSADFDELASWIEDAAVTFRAIHGNGNDAALRAAE